MNVKHAAKPTWTAADLARHQAVRAEFVDCPTQEDLQASGAFAGPIKSGAYFAVKILVHELKQAREAAGLTLAVVSVRAGMDQASLSRLENGRQPNPTIDTLWRYANAIGRRLVVTHSSSPTETRSNGKETKKQRKGIAKKKA